MSKAQSKALAKLKGEPIEASPKDEEGSKGRTVADFRNAMDQRRLDLEAMLPEHVSFDILRATALEAVRQNPELLRCEARSLLGAVSKAAHDGLLPDGREGVITHYKDTRANKLVASWNPMLNGLRKRARELDDIIVDADAVYAADFFDFEQGDNPRIIHKRPELGKDRGGLIGAYAIYRKGDRILHREVMDRREIELARAQSKMPDSLMWKKFPGEGYKKVVVRRGFKSVPCSPRLLEIVTSDPDTSLDFERAGAPVPAHEAAQIEGAGKLAPAGAYYEKQASGNGLAAEAPKTAEGAQGEAPATGKAAKGRKGAKASKGAGEAPVPAADTNEAAPAEANGEAPAARPTASAVRTAMWKANTPDELAAVWNDQVAAHEWPEADLAAIERTYKEREAKVARA